MKFPRPDRRIVFVAMVLAVVGGFQLPRLMSTYADDAPPAPAGPTPGLVIAFSSPTGPVVDSHTSRLPSLLVPAGAPPSPFLPPGPFKAVWTGLIQTKIKDTYQFSALGRGDLAITVNDQSVYEAHGEFTDKPSEPFTLKKGKNRLTITYTSPATGDSAVRVQWGLEGKPRNPIQPGNLHHDPADEVLTAHAGVRLGRDIVLESRCVACHTGIAGTAPELKQDAPNLGKIGDRLNADWIAAWVANPKGLRPTAQMPRVFHGDTADADARDVAEYLAPGPSKTETAPTDPDVLAKGARLFTGLGCVGCHVAPGTDDSTPEAKRVPLQYVKAKFKPGALAAFLKQPEAHYAWSRMPNFHLSEDEIAALSGWLIDKCKDNAVPAYTKGDAGHGKKLFESAGCLQCHATDTTQPKPPTAKDLAVADWKTGCVAGTGKGVDFGFTDEQKAALQAMSAAAWQPSLARDNDAEFAARQMKAVRCNACHSIDGVDSVWSDLDADVAAIEQGLPDRPANDPAPHGDQSRPPLTWVGEKLRPQWSADFIAGKVPYKPREWIFARMPSFASRAEGLAHGLAMQHGIPLADDPPVVVNAGLADTGRALTGTGRFECAKCHAVAAQAALAPFEAEAPNFAHVVYRLRRDYFVRWVRSPNYWLPGTKMPQFPQADGKTAMTEFGGDADKQFDAVWQYLEAGNQITPPP